MHRMPPLDELRKKYADVMADGAIVNLSRWTEPNNAEPPDVEAFLERAHRNRDVLVAKMEEALNLGTNAE